MTVSPTQGNAVCGGDGSVALNFFGGKSSTGQVPHQAERCTRNQRDEIQVEQAAVASSLLLCFGCAGHLSACRRFGLRIRPLAVLLWFGSLWCRSWRVARRPGPQTIPTA